LSLNKILQIGITGGIGSGKSLVSKIFSALGIPIYDADSHAKELMTTDGILISQIKKEFGDLSYEDGSLNRAYLANHVFHDEQKLEKLNSLVHPRVALHYQNWFLKNSDKPYVLKEAALLFETGSYKLLDKIIVVTAPEELRIQRVIVRDPHRTVEQIKAIVGKQMPEHKKQELADYLVVNDETQLLIPQILHLHRVFSDR
jgi:dephospho-CoA kinase